MEQQTAVEWLYNQLDGFSDEEWGKIDDLFKQAKQMEKEQMIDAWEDGKGSFSTRFPEQYYNETYGKLI